MKAIKFSTLYSHVIHVTYNNVTIRHMPGPAEAEDHSLLSVIFEAGTVKRDDIDQKWLSKTNTCWGENATITNCNQKSVHTNGTRGGPEIRFPRFRNACIRGAELTQPLPTLNPNDCWDSRNGFFLTCQCSSTSSMIPRNCPRDMGVKRHTRYVTW